MRSSTAFTLLALGFITTLVQAQHQMDTVVVTTTRIPITIAETGKSVTVLTSKQIQSLPVSSFDEILQTIPGLEVQSRGGFGIQGDVLVRGSTFTQVLILIDGIRFNDPLTGHFNSYIPITPAEIERIEVLRGSGAAMYGPDAVGGVINVISKTFSANQEGIQNSGNLNFGANKLVSGYQGLSFKKAKLSFGAGFSINKSEGQLISEKNVDSTTVLDAYNSYFDLKNGGVSIAYQINSKFSLKARSSFDFRSFDARYFYTSSPFDKSTETVSNWWNHIQLMRSTLKSSTDLNIGYKFNTDEFIFSPDFPSTNNHTTQYLNFTLNHLHEVNDQILLKAGLQIDQRKIESNDRGDHQDLHAGVYALSTYQNRGLNLTISLRGDYDENYEFEFLPQMNLSYVLPSLVLRGSVGRNIRAADYTERYVSNNLQNLTPGRSLGNPDLLAERGWSGEIGLDYAITSYWYFKTTAFLRQSNNLIDYVSTNEQDIGIISETGSLQENADYFFAMNISDVKTQGLEFETTISHSFKDHSIRWILGYTVLNTSNEEDIISVYISNHARHLLTTQFYWNWKGLELVLSGLYKERIGRMASGIESELSPSYDLWNTRVGLKLSPEINLNLEIRNVFNEKYQNVLGAQMPGRWSMVGLKWAF